MTRLTISPEVSPPSPAFKAPATTQRLLTCGGLAGPLFLSGWALQAFTREGFDPGRHPISLLSLGPGGWVQITNFVVTGLLVAASAQGFRRVLTPDRGSVWGPRLIAAMGAGLVLSGIFRTDPGAGFPAGAPAGAPQLSWHGVLHEVGYVVVMISWTAACFVLRRGFAARQQRGLSRLCVAAVVGCLVLSAWPHADSFTIRIVVATAVQFGLVAVLAARLRREPVRHNR